MKKVDNRTYSVYMHTTPDGRVYIGMTGQKPEDRWVRGEGYKSNPRFYQAIREEGWDNIEHEILETGLSRAEAAELEKGLIAEYNSTDLAFGYNMKSGGEGGHMLGRGQSLYCVETDTLYANAGAAAHDLGINREAMYLNHKHGGMTFLALDEDGVEQYKIFDEISQYPSLQGLSAEDLTDDICQLIFGE